MSAQVSRNAGLYVHVPFCSAVCPYCDFAVTTGDRAARLGFVEALLREIELYADFPLVFDTVYFGGGTPSSLKADDLDRILAALHRHLQVDEDAWLLLEANPEDVTADLCSRWSALGVRTLSLGVQSFDDEELRFLGRRHDGTGARRSVQVALDAGFHTVSVDLMYGLPKQTLNTWDAAVGVLERLRPQHVSSYQLDVADGTPFGRLRDDGRLVEGSEDVQATVFEHVHQSLRKAGYSAYEVSNFARDPEHRSPHNQKYWCHTPYLGLGPSAHSYHEAERWWNVRDVGGWQERVGKGVRPVAGREHLTPEQFALEALLLGLRTVEGVSAEEFYRRHGIDLVEANHELIEASVHAGHLRQEGGRLRPTVQGLAVADGLAAKFELPR